MPLVSFNGSPYWNLTFGMLGKKFNVILRKVRKGLSRGCGQLKGTIRADKKTSTGRPSGARRGASAIASADYSQRRGRRNLRSNLGARSTCWAVFLALPSWIRRNKVEIVPTVDLGSLFNQGKPRLFHSKKAYRPQLASFVPTSYLENHSPKEGSPIAHF